MRRIETYFRLTVFIRRALKGDIRPFSTVLELAGISVVAMKFRLVSTDIRQGRAWREVLWPRLDINASEPGFREPFPE